MIKFLISLFKANDYKDQKFLVVKGCDPKFYTDNYNGGVYESYYFKTYEEAKNYIFMEIPISKKEDMSIWERREGPAI